LAAPANAQAFSNAFGQHAAPKKLAEAVLGGLVTLTAAI
jgi:hypothetical protein